MSRLGDDGDHFNLVNRQTWPTYERLLNECLDPDFLARQVPTLGQSG